MSDVEGAAEKRDSRRLKPAKVAPVDPATRAILPYFAVVVGALMLIQGQSGLSESQLELSHGFGALLIIVALGVIVGRVLGPRLPK